MITEAHGIPLGIWLIGRDRNDVTQLISLISLAGAIPPVRGAVAGGGAAPGRSAWPRL